jgi:hypothetical protein
MIMNNSVSYADHPELATAPVPPLVIERARDVSSSGVSWSAVIGGAFAIAATTLVMLALGAGFGLEVVSPWTNAGASAATVGVLAIFWLVFTQVIASSLGGYLTGRVRRRWTAIHNDEVHFRDTANGFLAWAVSIVLSVAFLATAAVTMAGSAGAVTAGETGANHYAYFVDQMFRTDRPPAAGDMAARAEAARIFATDLTHKHEPPADLTYLAQLAAQRTGLNPGDALQRVTGVFNQARQTQDEARKSTAHLLLWTFVALLSGAFCASCTATVGGRQRESVRVI